MSEKKSASKSHSWSVKEKRKTEKKPDLHLLETYDKDYVTFQSEEEITRTRAGLLAPSNINNRMTIAHPRHKADSSFSEFTKKTAVHLPVN